MTWLDLPFLLALSTIAWCGLQLLGRRDFGRIWLQLTLMGIVLPLLWHIFDRRVAALSQPWPTGSFEIGAMVAGWLILATFALYLVLRLVVLVFIAAGSK